MNLGKLISKNVKALRVSKGLSQQEVADKTGLTVRNISRLENTSPNITIEIIEKLTKGLGCTVGDIVGTSDTDAHVVSKDAIDQTIRFLQSIRSRL